MLAVGLVLATLIGVSLGLLGGGGSILTVPTLLYVFRLPTREAIVTSLLVVATTSLAALVPHARAGRVQWRTGAVFGASSMLGAFGAGRVATKVPESLLLLGFGAMMVATAIAMLRGRRPTTTAASVPPPAAKVLAEGLAVGAVTGLVGAGGGFMVVPALALLGRLPMGQAIATSLMVIAMNSFAAFAGNAGSVHVNYSLAAMVTVAAVIGSVGGGALVSRVHPDSLRKGFGWFIVVMSIFVLGQEIPKMFGVRVSVATHGVQLFAAMAAPLLVAGLVRLVRGRVAPPPAPTGA
ncbi:MAG: sulfite exporter TauE/SafE family protein [Myxococcales bacterium]|nr:sulfite exporter TauE/SafE family protein [Myxococcales bacterium]